MTLSAGASWRRWLPATLLVAGLALVSAWVLRAIAPPSLLRDGQRLPVGMGAGHAGGGHHSSGSGGVPPSPVSDEPLPHYLGGAFLAVHVLALGLAVAIPVLPRVLDRIGLPRNGFSAQLLFSTWTGLAACFAVLLAARLGYGDRLDPRAVLGGGLEAARYGFVLALLVVVLFGVPWRAIQLDHPNGRET